MSNEFISPERGMEATGYCPKHQCTFNFGYGCPACDREHGQQIAAILERRPYDSAPPISASFGSTPSPIAPETSDEGGSWVVGIPGIYAPAQDTGEELPRFTEQSRCEQQDWVAILILLIFIVCSCLAFCAAFLGIHAPGVRWLCWLGGLVAIIFVARFIWRKGTQIR